MSLQPDGSYKFSPSVHKEIEDLRDRHHRETKKFYLNGVKETRKMLGPEEFDAMTDEQHKELFEWLFDRSSLAYAEAMFAELGEVFDLENLFLGDKGANETPFEQLTRDQQIRRRQCQIIRHFFVDASMAICDLVEDFATVENPDMTKWFEFWKAMPRQDKIQEGGFWTLEMMVIKPETEDQ